MNVNYVLALLVTNISIFIVLLPAAASRKDWTDYSEIDYARSQWLQSLKPQSDPDSYICTHLNNPKIATVFESVVVFRLQDITVACVMLDNQKEEERWPLPFHIAKNHKRRTVLETLDGEQKSLISNTFIASDTLMHKLPVKTNLITMDFTQCLSSESAHTGEAVILLVNKLRSLFLMVYRSALSLQNSDWFIFYQILIGPK